MRKVEVKFHGSPSKNTRELIEWKVRDYFYFLEEIEYTELWDFIIGKMGNFTIEVNFTDMSFRVGFPTEESWNKDKSKEFIMFMDFVQEYISRSEQNEVQQFNHLEQISFFLKTMKSLGNL